MSGQWEVVGKTKKDKQSGKSKKLSKNEMKKFVDNAPKVEDLLPLSQVKTLYAALDTNKEPPKPVEKATKTKENEAKKAQKKPKEKKEAPKEIKPPKTVEAAVALISTSDVQNCLEVGQLRFAEAPLVWLKGLASWLNAKLPVDHTDNAFTAKSWEYPLCLLNADTRAVLKKALKDVPDSAVQMFYDYCLTSMANDMTKGGPVTGYKMLLQLVASQQSSVVGSNLPKAVGLRHSYQNRPAIGCSIMWALGQAGFKDLSTGLQVWQSVMFPVSELRNYTQFVSDYLKHLLARHSTSKAVTTQQYLEILDTVSNAPHPPAQLYTHIHTLQGIVCNNQTENRLHSLFEALLSRLSATSPTLLKDELVGFLTRCLSDSQSFTEWRHNYTKYLTQSAVLLRHLNSNWSSLTSQLPAKLLKDTIKTFKVTNDDMTKCKQKAAGLQECSRLCDAILGQKPEGKSFPWKTISFVIILAIAGVAAFDVNTHGSFKASKIGIFLNDVGALKYGEQAATRIKDTWQISYRWSEQNLPVYWGKARHMLGPYFVLVTDFISTLALQVVANIKLFIQYCVEKKPFVEQWINQYAPGLGEAVSSWLSETWALTRHYGLQAGTLALKYLLATAEWLRDNVFVGNFSPENLQRVTLEAINTTQTLAAQTLSWFNSKVLTASSKSV